MRGMTYSRTAMMQNAATMDLNDPTQFAQVDETCGLSRVILCLKSLDVTAFLRIDAPWKI